MLYVRIATKHDIAAIDALMTRSYPRLLGADYAPSMLVMALPIISRAQPDLITCGTYYVAERDDTILGAGGWTVAAPGTGTVQRGVGHIRHVATDHKAIRNGVGRALLGHIFAQTKTQGLRRLQCLSTLTAVPFYSAMGFSAVTHVTVPLGSGIDFPAVDMTKEL